MKAAWAKFHDTFDDNQDELAGALFASCYEHAFYINPMNLSSTVILLKDLGRTNDAKTLIEHYVAVRGDKREQFDLEGFTFAGEIKDPDVLDAFKQKLATLTDKRDPSLIMIGMAEKRGWNDKDLDLLANLDVDEYVELFKSHHNTELHAMISACMVFAKMTNASDPMKEILRRAREALSIIGTESPLNALRVRKYGVHVRDVNSN